MTRCRKAAEVQVVRQAVRDDERVHVEGSGVCGTETLCGYVDTLTSWDDHPGPVTCRGCLDVIRIVRDMPPPLMHGHDP